MIIPSTAISDEALTNRTVRAFVTLPFRDMSFLSAIMYQGMGCALLAFLLSNVAILKTFLMAVCLGVLAVALAACDKLTWKG